MWILIVFTHLGAAPTTVIPYATEQACQAQRAHETATAYCSYAPALEWVYQPIVKAPSGAP